MSVYIKVTLSDEEARIMQLAAGFQGHTLAGFLRQSASKIIRQQRANMPFLTEKDIIYLRTCKMQGRGVHVRSEPS